MKFPEENHCMFICYAQGPEEYQLYIHLQYPGRCRIVHRPTGAEVTNVAGVAGFLSGSIVPSGASGKFHANRYIELKGLDQTAEGFGPGGRACGMGLRNWSGELVWGMEPSTISGFSVDGSALDIEPSMMQGFFVEGSTLRNGTFHGFGPQRGGFRSGG